MSEEEGVRSKKKEMSASRVLMDCGRSSWYTFRPFCDINRCVT